MMNNTLEAVKVWNISYHSAAAFLYMNYLYMYQAQRDLYLAARDLFSRHDRLSGDQVERIRKRIEAASTKLEAVKAAKKDNWADEADRIVGTIERDQAMITTLLSRRVFIRHRYVPSRSLSSVELTFFLCSMWHELRVVLHNRENTLVTLAVQLFAKDERNYSNAVQSNWNLLLENIDSMPLD